MTAPAYDLLIDDEAAGTGDLVMISGDLVINSGIDAVRQAAYSRLRFFKGEWFADELVGIDFWGSILIKNPSLPDIREIIRQELLATPGIRSVEQILLDLTNSTRALAVSFAAMQDDGTMLVADGLLLWSA